MTEPKSHELVLARASINLPGLRLGRVALVDPDEPYIAEAFTHGYLVRENPTDVAAAQEDA